MNQEVKQVRSEVADLKQTVDSRLRETRPIWEAVQSRLDDISEDLGNVDRKLDVLHGDVLQVRADQKRLNDRVDRLEK
jgi:peptidoglycan hydrolase CwlO-like protein